MALVAAGAHPHLALSRRRSSSAFDERLNVYLQTLVGDLAAQDAGQPLPIPAISANSASSCIYSGWYWQVRDADGGPVVLASRSLFTDTLDIAKATAHQDRRRRDLRRARRPRRASRCASWPAPSPSSGDHRYDVLVAGNAGELDDQIAALPAPASR